MNQRRLYLVKGLEGVELVMIYRADLLQPGFFVSKVNTGSLEYYIVLRKQPKLPASLRPSLRLQPQ